MRPARIALGLLALIAVAAAIGGRHDDGAVSAALPPALAPEPAPAETPKTPNDVFWESLNADKQLALGFYDSGACEAYVRENHTRPLPYDGAEKTICTIMKAFAHERSTRSPSGPNWVVPPHND